MIDSVFLNNLLAIDIWIQNHKHQTLDHLTRNLEFWFANEIDVFIVLIKQDTFRIVFVHAQNDKLDDHFENSSK